MLEVIRFHAWGFCPMHGEGDFTWLKDTEGTEEVAFPFSMFSVLSVADPL